MTETAPRKPLIWALDIATVTGWAIGCAGDKPKAKAVTLAPPHATSDVLFAGCLEWFSEAIDTGPTPDILALEELLPPTARKGKTNTGMQHKSAGLHGIIRALAKRAQIPEIISASVSDIRHHFIGERNLPREIAKPRVFAMCKQLGWAASGYDAADALALWSYTAALINPHSALALTPLFGAREPARTWEDVARDRATKPQRG